MENFDPIRVIVKIEKSQQILDTCPQFEVTEGRPGRYVPAPSCPLQSLINKAMPRYFEQMFNEEYDVDAAIATRDQQQRQRDRAKPVMSAARLVKSPPASLGRGGGRNSATASPTGQPMPQARPRTSSNEIPRKPPPGQTPPSGMGRHFRDHQSRMMNVMQKPSASSESSAAPPVAKLLFLDRPRERVRQVTINPRRYPLTLDGVSRSVHPPPDVSYEGGSGQVCEECALATR